MKMMEEFSYLVASALPRHTWPQTYLALLRAGDFYPLVSLDKALLNPCFCAGDVRGDRLTSH